MWHSTLTPLEYLHSIQPQSFPWGPSPTARASAPSPHLLQADESVWASFWLEIAIWHNLCAEFSPFCIIVLPSEVPKLPYKGFLVAWKLLLLQDPLLRMDSQNPLSPFLSLSVALPHSSRLACLSGLLASSPRVQKMFCRNCSTYRLSFDVFVGEKVVSPSNSSTILKPPPFYIKFWNKKIWNFKLYFVYTLFCWFRVLEFHMNFRMKFFIF